MTVAGDRVPRSYRDDRDIAIGSAEYLKERNPTCEVAVRDLEGRERLVIKWRQTIPPSRREARFTSAADSDHYRSRAGERP
jgi:hypothetical protein